MGYSKIWIKSASDDELEAERERLIQISLSARDNNDMKSYEMFGEVIDQIDDELDERYSSGNQGECESCGQSLSKGDYHAPWEDGNNAIGYVRCPYCGYKNMRY